MKYLHLCAVGLIAVLVISGRSISDPVNKWVKYYGDQRYSEQFFDLIATHEGGYAMTGTRRLDQSHIAAWLVTTDEEGFANISETYMTDPTIKQSYGYSLIQTSRGDFVIGGKVIKTDWSNNFFVIRVDSAGGQLWHYLYPWATECRSVIELKAGSIVAAGLDGYAVCLNAAGEVIWDNDYRGPIYAIREVEDGLVFAGKFADDEGLLFKTDFNGQVTWEKIYDDHDSTAFHAMVTCPNGGFAASGGPIYSTIYTNSEGNEEWHASFNPHWTRQGWGIARLFDGSFVLVGSDQGEHQNQTGLAIIIDSQGQLMWEANGINLDGNHIDSRIYNSVIIDRKYYIMVAGEASNAQAMLLRIAPAYSPPIILDTIPNTTDMTLVRGDTVFFDVTAEDAQGDSLYYYWSLDWDTISTDTSVTITFNELGEHLLQLWVSDGQYQDSCFWTIHVKEVMVTGYKPQELRMTLLRDSEVPFKASCRASPGDAIDLAWMLDGEVVSQVDSALIRFSESGNHKVKYQASTGEYADTVLWNVGVNAVLVTDYEPDSLVLSLKRHAVVPFKIVADVSPGDTLTYRWYWVESDETIATTDTATVQFEIPGRWQLRGEARCGEDRAWQTWAVEVRSIIYDWLPIATTLAPSQDTTVTFTIVPSDTSSDSLRYRWMLDGDSVGADGSSALLLTAPARHTVKGYLWDGAEVDSVVWESYPPNQIEESRIKIQEFGLSEPFPNPFNQSSVVSYQLSVGGKVNLSLYDIGGRLVATLANGWQGPGEHRVEIGQARSPAPLVLPTGIYLIRLEAGSNVITRKAVVVR